MEEYKYFAFISYNSKDFKWGKKLEKKLSRYKMSSTLCKEKGLKKNPLKPIFFAPYDIQPGSLSEELKSRLRSAKNLIVICSPNSAKSDWVGREISYFYSLGRAENIFFFIVDGTPNSNNQETECYNPVIKQLHLDEYLGVNIHEKVYKFDFLNRERAYIQLITKLLNIEFDVIWNRHKRMMILTLFNWCLGVIVVLLLLFMTWNFSRSVDVKLRLLDKSELNVDLPPLQDAITKIFVGNECKTDTIYNIEDNSIFRNIPRKFIGNKVRFKIECYNYIPVDTEIILKENNEIDIHRDKEVFGNIYFRVWNGKQFVPNYKMQIDGHNVTSNNRGEVILELPLSQQKEVYRIVGKNLLTSEIIMPLSPDAIVLVAD